MSSNNQEIEHIPYSDQILSGMSVEESNACNLALDNINSKGQA